MPLLCLLQGCLNLNPKVQPVRFYALKVDPLKSQVLAPQTHVEGPIGIALVELPAYLNSHKIAIQDSPQQIHYQEYDRWAEPLDEALTRGIAELLQWAFPESLFLIAPWRYQAPKTLLRVQVRDLQLLPKDGLKGRVEVVLVPEKGGVIQKIYEIHVPLKGAGIVAYVDALNDWLVALTGQMAKDLL